MEVDGTPPHRNGTVPVMTKSSRPVKPSARPTVEDIQGNNFFAEKAREIWLDKKKPPKVRHEIVNELWTQLEKDGFRYADLLVLETVQALERYLWPGYSEDSSNNHVLLLAIIVNVKRRESLPSWSHFEDRPADFSSYFRRVLSMSVDASLPTKLRGHLLSFIIGAFESLDNGLVRKECAPLVSVGIWHNMHSEATREEQFKTHVMLRKAWRAVGKKYEGADAAGQAKLRFDRSWLYTLLLEFINMTYDLESGDAAKEILHYCERFVELLIDLQSQLPTRRYVNSLLQDLNFLTATQLSPLYEDNENGLFKDLFKLLQHYTDFPINDHSGQQLTQSEYHQYHCAELARLQRTAFQDFPEKLKILTLSNFGTLGKREELQGHLKALEDDELLQLVESLGFRTSYPSSSALVRDRAFWLQVLTSAFALNPTFQETVKTLAVVPTEKALFDKSYLRQDTYNGSRPLAIPKINLQYLAMGDFLWRSFILYRAESFYAIRKDIEDTVKRMQPRAQVNSTTFGGQSRMALPIAKPAILDVAPAHVGDFAPAKVKAEVLLDVYRLNYNVRREWESLRPGDIVFLAGVHPLDEKSGLTNGFANAYSAAERAGIRCLRTAEVEQVLDHQSRPLREPRADAADDGEFRRPRQRRLILRLDSAQFEQDRQEMSKGKPDIYNSINLIIRRRGRENNFKPVLETIRKLTLSDTPTPSWFQDVFLGYGDPAGASYKRLPNRLQSIDFRDTFLDWQHLIQSFPGILIEPAPEAEASFGPPYMLDYSSNESIAPETQRTSKKRRRGEDKEQTASTTESIKVSTYSSPNNGPYPIDAPKANTVRFTPMQIEAITSGTQPGLTVIVGPPGTGKTDVATQIINNIYHDFPNQRTLLIAHSNQALNQLFQKIIALDIDERHLLRLGHGEEDLATDSSYSKFGRVESFLQRAGGYLAEVNRLAASLNAPGAHGNSCETADYFNAVYVKPAWNQYWESVQGEAVDTAQIIDAFPFRQYFANAPQPLFPTGVSNEELLNISRGCYRHIEKIFTELEDIRPFEILRNQRDKANYLLVKEARIIAMTATHAAMRRQEIAGLGFHYDNVIMEEAAQVTEIENFIPLAMQKPQDGQLPLQRIVLCGDHLQNSPIIQNLAFRHYANLEQSLFLRLVRLGVPTITLDQQGRARPSLAELYRWRYPSLQSLPSVETSPEFMLANAGLKYDYQFIDVPDYKGRGEAEPTPHFIQNLGEAEYAVALFMYMRLLGYPAHKISILAMYAGQRALIKDVLAHRCKGNRLFGLPRIVTTVDKYQGEQNDFIILSLTRTSRPGYIRDLRRLTVALSRSRLGLYILGRRSVFESCYELREAFELLFARPTKLVLVKNETYPSQRLLSPTQTEAESGKIEAETSPKKKSKRIANKAADVATTTATLGGQEETVEVEGVEHLGRIVFEMTQKRVQELKEGRDVLMLPPAQVGAGTGVDGSGAEVDGGEEDDEDDGEGPVEDVLSEPDVEEES